MFFWAAPSGLELVANAMDSRRRRVSGFTLMEIVVVTMILGVIAAIGVARMGGRDPAYVQTGAEQLLSGLRLAQATAIAQRRPIHVRLSSSPANLDVCLDSACALRLSPPGGDETWLTKGSDLRLSTEALFQFDGSGAPSLTSSLAVQVTNPSGNVTSTTITVEAITGHVHLR